MRASRRGAALIGATALLALAAVDAQEATPGSQWLTNNNRLDGVRFSPLREITPANAAQLKEVCRIQIDGPTTYHAGIVVADGVLYTDTGRETIALDPATCAVRWKYTYQPEEERYSPSNRGLAVMGGRVFRGTGDARLIALDAATGKLLWKNVIGSPGLGEAASGVPLAWQGVVYMGIAGSELGVRGRVMAYDAQSGRELWRFNTIPMGAERGADTWKRPESARTGGGGIWGSMSLDVTTGELFVSVGNPWPDIDKGYRPGANLFTDSVVILDARTGALKWWYQLKGGDWQDFDLVAAPVLYRDSHIRDIVAVAGKDGYVTALDRATHKPIFRTPVTTIVDAPVNPRPEGFKACPGYAGGVEWNGPGLDRVNHTLITGAVDACFIVKLGTTHYAAGEANFGGTIEPEGPTTGWLTAIDSETGEVRWRYHAEKPVIAGVTPTASGVTFTGDLAGNLLVFNSKTGELLNKIPTGGALAGGVVTYEAGGHQYVAAASGNVSRNAFGALGVPSVVIFSVSGKPVSGAVTAPASSPGTHAPAGAPDIARGRKLYSQICVSCHGAGGDQVADHRLTAFRAGHDQAAVVGAIKEPKAPMPKLYPDLISDQNVADVAAFVREELGR
ncbi:MAG TPA: PQQ-binding-like beta-propeller repeat protein [Steroidobacteraceae bacterium]|nr:PQQ-binding-like beta-propeller repeat protein [Steroidobacteraceae bacterium]